LNFIFRPSRHKRKEGISFSMVDQFFSEGVTSEEAVVTSHPSVFVSTATSAFAMLVFLAILKSVSS